MQWVHALESTQVLLKYEAEGTHDVIHNLSCVLSQSCYVLFFFFLQTSSGNPSWVPHTLVGQGIPSGMLIMMASHPLAISGHSGLCDCLSHSKQKQDILTLLCVD